MNDPARALRGAYIANLTGITSAGKNVPIYDSVTPPNVVYPHILIGDQSFFQRKVKNCYITDATLIFEIVTVDYKGKKQADEIAEQMIPILMTGELDMGASFTCDFKELSSNDSIVIESREGSAHVVRQITIRNLIKENG
jgi:hypothetical protein